ncbi:MAG: hypothetical protein MZV65_18225 [Chromatiales bacterium]|nr:hypothetical protein [Chromatiales bacterium]
MVYYQENADDSGQYKLTEKIYLPLGSRDGWRFTGRVDVPFLYTNKEGSGNPDGDWEFHVGDSLTELYATSPPVAPHLTLGGSLRLVWPTGGQPPFGAEQYQWAPASTSTIACRISATASPSIHSPAILMSYHASSAGAAKIRKLDLYPRVTPDLPEQWFIVLYPENPIEYNEITGQWFVPFEAMVGKDLSERLHLSFGGRSSWEATIRSISTCSERWSSGGSKRLQRSHPQCRFSLPLSP